MYEIYSPLNDCEEWEERRIEIQSALDITINGAIKVGKTSHHIILIHKKGKPIEEKIEVHHDRY
jgi:hypothetical protein